MFFLALFPRLSHAAENIVGTATRCWGDRLEITAEQSVTSVTIHPYVWGWPEASECRAHVLEPLRERLGDDTLQVMYDARIEILYLLDRVDREEYVRKYRNVPRCDARFRCFDTADTAGKLSKSVEEKKLMMPEILQEGYACAPTDAAPMSEGGPPKWAGFAARFERRGLWATDSPPEFCRTPKRPPRNAEFIDDKPDDKEESAIVPTAKPFSPPSETAPPSSDSTTAGQNPDD